MDLNYFVIRESVIEKLHPLTKMLFLLLIIIFTLLLDDLVHVSIVALLVLVYIALARLLIKLLPFILFYLLSASCLIGLLYFLSGKGIQFEIGLLIFLKFFAHIFSGLVLAFTTSPRKMAAALKQLGLPSTILFIFILALRLFPVIIKEYQYIIDSLRLRNQSIIRVLLFQPQLVIFPIMVRSVKLSDELSLSAETRGFSMQNLRLPSLRLQFSALDFVFLLGMFFIFTLLTVMEFGI